MNVLFAEGGVGEIAFFCQEKGGFPHIFHCGFLLSRMS